MVSSHPMVRLLQGFRWLATHPLYLGLYLMVVGSFLFVSWKFGETAGVVLAFGLMLLGVLLEWMGSRRRGR